MSVYTLKVHEDGKRVETWESDNQLHRLDGPALIKVDRAGERTEAWYMLGHRHRRGGPALTITADGGYRRDEWFENGRRHNDNGPAIAVRHADGGEAEEWWVNGRRVESPSAPSKPLDFAAPIPTYSLQADTYGYLTLWVDAGGDAPVPLARERDVNPGVWELLLKGAGNPQRTPKSA